jgi:uncharacterized protein YjiS (DUF1127 family)
MMAATQPNDTKLAGPYLAIEARRRVYRLWREFVRTLAIRQLRQALRAMPDWLLHDIGVKRSDIDAVAVWVVDGVAIHPSSTGFSTNDRPETRP